MPEFKLPDVGEGLTEAEIVSWRVKEGDTVAINDIIVDIETAKSIVELPSPFAGVVSALLVAEGEMVPVGTPIIAIGDPAAAPATPAPAMEIDLSNPAASGSSEGESLVGRMKADRGPTRRARRAPATPSTSGGAAAQVHVQSSFEPGPAAEVPEEIVGVETPVPASPAPEPASAPTYAEIRPLAKPPVRKLAKDLDVDLAALVGTGEGGVITRADVEGAGSGLATSYAGTPRDVTAPAQPGRLAETREPIKGVRKMMGQAMVDSAFSAPHVTEWLTFDITATMQLVERLKARRELREVRVSPLLVLAKAVLLAVRRTPEINSTWEEATQEVVYKHYVNLGIAAATPRGLVVPNIKGADELSLVELAGALGALTATAREGRTQPAEMAGGTLTITNVGVFGVDAGTPIINPGESAILCFGAAKRQPWVVGTGAEERIEIRDVCTLALSFDHRHVDGEKGSRFLADVAGILEDPASALLF